MNPNLKWKALFIVLLILGCIYGLVGWPTFPTSVAQLKDNFSHQIKLGLDLQGGTHLILQVQVQEAIAQETDLTVDRLTTQLRAQNIRYEEVRRVDDTHILVHSVDSAQLSQFRDLVSTQFGRNWDLSAAPGDPSKFDHSRPAPKQSLPYDWDSNEATSEAWAGEDEPMAEYLASALRENGIPSRIPDEPGHRVRLCVRPEDLSRARDIVREITEGASTA